LKALEDDARIEREVAARVAAQAVAVANDDVDL